MSNKNKATFAAPKNEAKIQKYDDKERVRLYFMHKEGTTLDCAFQTGILRNSITWHVSQLEHEGRLQAIMKKKDRTTHRRAKYYSANPAKWVMPRNVEPTFFSEEDFR